MTIREAKRIIKNNYAVLSQPIGLLVILIVASLCISLIWYSIQTLMGDTELNQVEYELSSILTQASTMFEYANEGSSITVHVEFPRSLRFLVFGALPRNGTSEPTNLTLDENSSNNYFFVMNDGTTKVFHSNARFSGENLTRIALFHAGTYNLTLELRSSEGKTYVAMYT
jgi:hypothetical protein